MLVARSLADRPSAGRGFSLVELLVAMVIGLFLIGGTTMVFLGNVRSAELGQAVASLQANARYALDAIAADIRAAGYRGCASVADTPFLVSTDDAPLDASRPDASALVGARIASDGWKPSAPVGYTAPGGRAAPVVGTDALMVQYGVAPGEALRASMSSTSGTLAIDGTMAGLETGDLALVADCSGAELFEVSARTVRSSGTTLQPVEALSRRYARDPRYPKGTLVMPFTAVIYYVGDSGRVNRTGDAIRSLYLQTLPFDVTDNPPIELVEGVDQLRLAFGVRESDGDLRFLRADDADFDAARASSVRVGLLMSSLERLDDGAVPPRFSLAGETVLREGETGAQAFYPADRRLRIGFERSVTVRNRALQEHNT